MPDITRCSPQKPATVHASRKNDTPVAGQRAFVGCDDMEPFVRPLKWKITLLLWFGKMGHREKQGLRGSRQVPGPVHKG